MEPILGPSWTTPKDMKELAWGAGELELESNNMLVSTAIVKMGGRHTNILHN